MARAELLKRLACLEARAGTFDGMPRGVEHDYLGLRRYDKPPWQIVRHAQGATLYRNTRSGELVVLPRGIEGVYC